MAIPKDKGSRARTYSAHLGVLGLSRTNKRIVTVAVITPQDSGISSLVSHFFGRRKTLHIPNKRNDSFPQNFMDEGQICNTIKWEVSYTRVFVNFQSYVGFMENPQIWSLWQMALRKWHPRHLRRAVGAGGLACCSWNLPYREADMADGVKMIASNQFFFVCRVL